MDNLPGDLPASSARHEFATTHWSLIAAAGNVEKPEAQAALNALCSGYWYPLYAFLRRSGSDREQAQDLTQSFFLDLIEHRRFEIADRERGRFRSFLLASVKHFRANRYREDRSLKRGGQTITVPIDFESGEHRYTNEPLHELTPERLYDRKWALQLIHRALDQLEVDALSRQRGELFNLVKPLLSGESSELGYQQIGEQLNMTANAVKVAVHRWREEFAKRIREQIRNTVSSENDVEQEIELLFQAIAD